MADVVIFCGYQDIVSTKPAGAYVIANTLRKCGMSVMVINFTLMYHRHNVLKKLIERFVNNDTKFICISNTIMSNPNNADKSKFNSEMNEIINQCMAKAPHATRIMGGSDIVQSKGLINLNIHYAIEGQGEAAMLAVINHVINGTELVVTEVFNGVKYVSDKVYGYGTFNADDNYIFHDHDCIQPGETLPIEIGRGCVFKCSYCNFPLNGKRFEDFNKSTDLVYDTLMRNYEKFGVTRYTFIDDTINDSIEKAVALEKVVSRLPFKLQFGGFMRLELFQKHPEMADIYKNCGLVGANFGIETFNREAGLTVGKGFGEKAKDVLMFLKDKWGNDISTMGSFIIGLPYDTPENIKDQFDWIDQNSALTYYRSIALEVREGDYLLKDKKMQNYYKFIRLPKGIVYDWESPLMTRKEAMAIGNFYMERCNKLRDTMFKQLDGFRMPVALQYHSMEELKITHGNKYREFEKNVLLKQMKNFYELAMNTTIETTNPNTWVLPNIQANTNVFKEKIRA
jgi:hypothetical protein